jgi:hypothetical protein
MAVIPVPSLDTRGFITDGVTKFSMLMAHIFIADYNQTSLYPGMVTSLPKIIEQAGQDPSTIAATIQQAISSYLSAYYHSSTVVVNIPNADLSALKVNVDIQVEDEGTVVQSQTWQFVSKNNVLANIISINNTGNPL